MLGCAHSVASFPCAFGDNGSHHAHTQNKDFILSDLLRLFDPHCLLFSVSCSSSQSRGMLTVFLLSSLLSNSFSLIGAWGLMVVLLHRSPCWRGGIGIFHVLLIILFCAWIVHDLSCCCYWPVDFGVQIYHGLSILTLLVLCWLKRCFLLWQVSYIFLSIENGFLFI